MAKLEGIVAVHGNSRYCHWSIITPSLTPQHALFDIQADTYVRCQDCSLVCSLLTSAENLFVTICRKLPIWLCRSYPTLHDRSTTRARLFEHPASYDRAACRPRLGLHTISSDNWLLLSFRLVPYEHLADHLSRTLRR